MEYSLPRMVLATNGVPPQLLEWRTARLLINRSWGTLKGSSVNRGCVVAHLNDVGLAHGLIKVWVEVPYLVGAERHNTDLHLQHQTLG